MPCPPSDDPLRSALFTDLYELTMAQAYAARDMHATAVFELFFRVMPESRNYMIAAGLDDVLDYLATFHFTESDLAYLREHTELAPWFLDRLAHLRFEGDVYAVPEGTPVFANEPIVQVVAPIIEAQLVETFVLNQIHFQTIAATKASRVVLAAAGRNVVDFGSRRAHGADAALKVARCSYLVGAVGTSNVLAGKRYEIPIFGTMAHSYIQAHDDELNAFEEFAEQFPGTTLLVDTYDTLEGVRKVIRLHERLGTRFHIRAVRLDSGNLEQLAKQTRQLLDEAGLHEVRIFASSGLDEYKVAALVKAGAPIDGFGVGTKMAVSPDATDLDMAYKLVEYDGRPRMKTSGRKAIYPGRKQVFRRYENTEMVGDTIGRFDETLPGRPLLEPVMIQGKRLPEAARPLPQIRRYATEQLEQLPPRLRQLARAEPPYDVGISDALQRERDMLDAQLHGRTHP